MSEPSSVNTIARERIDTIASRNGEPDWLKDLRFKAWEAYFRLPMPTNRDEDWRTTQIESLDLTDLQAVDLSNGGASTKAPAWLTLALEGFGKKAGIVSEGISGISVEISEELKKKGVVFCSIKEAVQHQTKLLTPFIEGRESTANLDKFGLMNDALFNAGAFLYVPANVEIEETFVAINNVALGSGDSLANKGSAVFPRLIVVLEKHAKANLVHILSSDKKVPEKQKGDKGSTSTTAASSSGSGSASSVYATSLVNASIEVYLRDGSNLRYVEMQKHESNVFAITRCNNEIHKDAKLNSLTVGLSGMQLKSDIRTNLCGAGSSSDVLGIVFGDQKESFSFNTIQDHNAQSTRSNINFKVVLKDQATSIYQGIIKVSHEGQKTDAFQSNKNLLLGTSAKADSIPKLEILADDVKCSHGATVGPVDREQIFYLMSRGLPAKEAEELIVGGFVRQVLESCEVPGAADWIESLISEKIHGKPNHGNQENHVNQAKEAN
jgi:Fe-S cluster assembly protein SufD